MRDRFRHHRLGLFAGAAALSLGACDAILGAGDRELNNTIVCTDDGCTCAAGLGDCDGLPDNGCEADLSSQEACGACGRPCENGACQDAVCVCDADHAECDGDLETVCETSTTTDPESCGMCGRSCGGSMCEGGLCVPEQVTSGFAYSFVLADGTIYFAGSGMGMFRQAVESGAPEAFGDPTQFVYLMHHHGDAVYWTSEEAVFATSTVTGETVQLATQQGPWSRLAAGGDKVYWGDVDPGTNLLSVHRAPMTPGGAVESVAALGDANFVFDFAVTEDHVYWPDISQLLRSPHDGLSPEAWKAVQELPTFMEPGASGLLYTGSPRGTFLVPYAAGGAKQIADVEGYGMLTSDAENVYFVTAVFNSDQPAAIWRAPLSGEGPAVKLAQETFLTATPMAVDDKYLYWIGGQAGVVQRVPK